MFPHQRAEGIERERVRPTSRQHLPRISLTTAPNSRTPISPRVLQPLQLHFLFLPPNLPIPSLIHVLRVFIKQIQLGCIFRHTLEYVLHDSQHGRERGRVAGIDLAAEARGEVGVVACGEEVPAPKV